MKLVAVLRERWSCGFEDVGRGVRELLACAIEVLECLGAIKVCESCLRAQLRCLRALLDVLEVYESCLRDLDMATLSTREEGLSSCAPVEVCLRIVQEQEFIARFWRSRSVRVLLVCFGCGSTHVRGGSGIFC
jgi:hypothetical protein